MRFGKLFLIICAAVFICVGCGAEPENNGYSASEEEVEYTEDYYDRLFLGDVVTDEEKRENIFAALAETKMNTEFIKDFAKIEDESGEEKYSFTYRNNPFIVYMNSDSTVSSVRVGEDGADIYLEGYESYNVDDYIIIESQIKGFQYMMINAVEIAFNYPEIYEFADDWTYRHEENFYYTRGSVFIGEAKEAHYIDLVYYYEEAENTMHWYSLCVDGNDISFERVFEEPEKTERQPRSGKQ